MYILIVAATTAEIAQTISWLDSEATPATGQCISFTKNNHFIDLLITGIGIHNTTYQLTRQLLAKKYDLVLQAGVAGSYDTSLLLGSVLRVQSDLFADLGIEDHERYLDLFDAGLAGPEDPPYSAGRLPAPTLDIPALGELTGVTALTVNTVSGCERTIELRRQKYRCTVESMEGAALHFVCLKENVPFVQVRALSNYVTPRDRNAWRMKEAIVNLNKWLTGFLETHLS